MFLIFLCTVFTLRPRYCLEKTGFVCTKILNTTERNPEWIELLIKIAFISPDITALSFGGFQGINQHPNLLTNTQKLASLWLTI